MRLPIMFPRYQRHPLTNNTKGFHRFETRIMGHQSFRDQMLRQRETLRLSFRLADDPSKSSVDVFLFYLRLQTELMAACTRRLFAIYRIRRGMLVTLLAREDRTVCSLVTLFFNGSSLAASQALAFFLSYRALNIG